MKIIAVDHGTKRIGLAISDPSGSISRPLLVLPHISLLLDAVSVAVHAADQKAEMVVIGQSLDDDGNPTLAGRQAAHFAEALKIQTNIPVILWDEAFTTKDARTIQISSGASRKKRTGHLDDLAAAVLLQSYLDVIHAGKNMKNEK